MGLGSETVNFKAAFTSVDRAQSMSVKITK
jgi:hypothetical protein